MATQTVKLGGKRFVIVAEKDFRDLQRKAKSTRARPAARNLPRSEAMDRADIATAKRILSDPNVDFIPYEQVRREWGMS